MSTITAPRTMSTEATRLSRPLALFMRAHCESRTDPDVKMPQRETREQRSPASALDRTRVWLCEDCLRPLCQASSSSRSSTPGTGCAVETTAGQRGGGRSVDASPTRPSGGRSARALRQLCSCAHECPARLSSSRDGHSSCQVASTRRRDLTRQPTGCRSLWSRDFESRRIPPE